MKKILSFAIVMTVFAGSNAVAQENEVETQRKEIRVENNNGNKKVIILQDKNGKITKEEYTGKDADKKLKELEKENKIKDVNTHVETVRFDNNNGKKKLTVIRIDNGGVTEDVFEGEEAEKKLQELQERKTSGKKEYKILEKEKPKLEKSNL